MELPVFGILWMDPHGGVGSTPRRPDGSVDPTLTQEEALFEGQILADLSPAMIVMLIEEKDLR